MNTIHKFYRAAITLIGVWSILFSAIQPSVVSAQQGKDGLKRQKNAQTGKVNFLGPETGRALPAAQALGLSFGKAHPADPALALAQHFAPEFGVKNPNQDLKEIRKNESKNGRITARYQQTYQDIPVMGGELIVNTNEAGDLYSMNGEVSQDLSLQTQPEIDSAQAMQTALQAMTKWYQKSTKDFQATEPALWIFDESLLQTSTRPAELVWRMEVTAKDNSMPVRELVLVSAKTGIIPLHFNQIDTAWGEVQQPRVNKPTLLNANPVGDHNSAPISTSANMPALLGATWYVATTGDDVNNDCATTSTPCATINGAIGKATSGDTILVATGTYTSAGSPVVLINKTITLSGGWDAGFTTQSGTSIIDGQNVRQGVYVNSTNITVSLDRLTVKNGNSSQGGGVYNNGILTLNKVTISNNSASSYGGGIYNSGNLTLNNATVSNNSASSSGGGIYNNSGTLTLNNITVSGNSSSSGGGIFSQYGHGSFKNSILAGNTVASHGPDCIGGFTSGGNNIISNTSGCTNSAINGDQFNVNPMLGIFLPTLGYYPLQVGSPAIEAGNPANCLPTDQRGVARVGVCDIGAYEYTAPGTASNLFLVSGSGQSVTPNFAFVEPLKGMALDSQGSPVPNVNITFTAPESGASGTFADTGTNTTSVFTDVDGIATASAFTANEQVGAYVVTASASGVSSINFDLVNIAWTALPFVSTYTANNSSSLPGSFLCDQTQPNCTNGANPHADAAHKYAIGTYNFYATQFNRDSVNNNGMTITATVQHCDPDFPCPYANAYWDGTQIVYGSAYGFPLADDVVAHELTHGVTQYESNLFYLYQSGAINESFSDLWGEYYDQTNGLGNDAPTVKWLLGEDISGLGANRNMKNPPQFGDPDKMTSSLYKKSLSDNGGIHHNSGVNNKAVYLMVDGGTFSGKTVTSLGWERVGAIYYEAQTNLLFSGADYSDLYYALQQACTNLLGQHGITSADCAQVQNALDAVQMNASSSFTPEAPLCPTGMTLDPSKILFEDNLESSLVGKWSMYGVAWSLEEGYASSGTHMFFGDDYYPGRDSRVTLSAGVSIPPGTSAFLHFKHAYLFDYFVYQGTPYYFDGGVVEYSLDGGSTWKDAKPLFASGKKYGPTLFRNSGNPLKGRPAFVGDSHGYVSSLFNLSPLAGKTVKLRWRMGTDQSVSFFGWFIDDIEVNTCVPIPAVPVLVAPAQGALVKDYTPVLDWSDTFTGLDHYQVQVADNSAFTAPVYDDNSLIASYFEVPSDLTPNTTYYWRVRSFNNLGDTKSWTVARSFRTIIVPPTLTAPADATQLDNRRPLFNWDDVAGATGYQFVLSKQANLGNPLKNIPVLASEYLPPDLPANTLFYWRVMAKGPNGPSAWSDTHSFTTGNPASTPVLVAPGINALVKDYTPLLDWKNSTVPAGTTFKRYELQVDDNNDFGSPAINIVTSDGILTESSFTPPSDLTPNTKYFWRVRSVNLVSSVEHFSSWSKVWTFRAAMLAPTLVSPADTTTVGSLKPALDWDDVTGATSYTIQIATSASFGTIVLTKNSATSDFTLVTNLLKNKTFYWRVRALGLNGPSDWSIPFSFHTPQ